MVIENIKSIIGYSSNSLPKDFSKLLDSLKRHQSYDQSVLDLVYDAYNFVALPWVHVLSISH